MSIMDEQNSCIVVEGEVAILIDEISDAKFLREKAFEAIAKALENSTFLDKSMDSVVRAAFISKDWLIETSGPYDVDDGVDVDVAGADASDAHAK